MYNPDQILCEQFIDYYSNNNFRLDIEAGVIRYKNISQFRISPHYIKDNYVGLANVESKKEYRGNGNGSKMLSSLCQFLDDKNLTCEVYPESYGENKNDRKLRSWYKRHGFKPVKGKNTMVRKPI